MADYLSVVNLEDYDTGDNAKIEDLLTRRDNMPGLGDYHLRSAIKRVRVSAILKGKGRPREKYDMNLFSEELGIKKEERESIIQEGDAHELLSYVLSHPSLFDDTVKYGENNLTTISNIRKLAFSAVSDRIKMELNRDYTKLQSKSEDRFFKHGLRPKMYNMFSDSENSTTIYSNCRIVTESIVMFMNSISSKRYTPMNLDSEIIFAEREGKTKGGMIKMGPYRVFLGSELVFYSRYWEDSCELYEKVNSLFKEESSDLVSDSDLVWKCVSVDCMRMINDKVTERDICLRACKIMHPALPEVYPSYSEILTLFSIGDLCLIEMGENAYKFFKTFESLIIGELLTRCDNIIVNGNEFLENTCRDLVKLDLRYSKYLDLLLSFLQNCPNENYLSQYYGLFRIWGHPTVNSVEGLKKVKKLGTDKQKIVITSISDDCGRIFKESVFLGYFKRQGRYPAFEIIGLSQEDTGHYIVERLKENSLINIRSNKYILKDWDYIKGKETFSLPKTYNLSMVIDDKAVSPDKEYLIKVANGSKNLMNPFERRGVLKWMNTEFQDCESLLRSVNDGLFPDKDCVIGLYPKERELNSTPRMFALMSAELRNYIVVSEHMIADDILPFFPQITMTDNLLDLTKKIYSTTRAQERSKNFVGSEKQLPSRLYFVTVCVNMDFEKWNLNMRYSSTEGVFSAMGELYGMPNLFNATYDIFERSFIYVSDEMASLQTIYKDGKQELLCDGVHSYTGHIGGFEGLRQKGWTVFTVCAIQLIMRRYPVSYKLMGQGDNQVLMITMRSSRITENGMLSDVGITELSKLLTDIMKDLEMTFQLLGLPLKTLESWKSEDFFLYGKFPVKRGVPLSLSLKKICRAFPFSNDDTMTLDNVLGAIFTNAQAAAMADVVHIPSYYLGLYESILGVCMILSYNPMSGKSFWRVVEEDDHWYTIDSDTLGKQIRKKHKIDLKNDYIEFATILSMLPKSLGGSNGLTEYEFVMRGFPDNQSRDLTYLTEILKGNPSNEFNKIKLMIMNFIRLPFAMSKNLDFLIEDPCALNLLQPETPLTLLRKKVKKVLGENVSFTNREFMELFTKSSDKGKRDLLVALSEKNSLFPRMLHDCYSASLFGYIDGIVSKVDKTVTVQRMCVDQSSEDIIKTIIIVECNFMKYLYWRASHYRYVTEMNEPSYDCPTNYIRWARDHGWGKEISGVTVPYPSHTLSPRPVFHAAHCKEGNYISSHISDNIPSNRLTMLTKIGHSPPYLGSKTKEKINKYDKVVIYGREPLIQRIIKLLQVSEWGGDKTELQSYLSKLLNSVSDLDPSFFILSRDKVGGSMEHRYQDMALKHGAMTSCMYGLGTWIHLSTDQFSDFSKGSKNVTLHFQAMLCWIQTIMYEILLSRRSKSKYNFIKEYHFHLDCRECIKTVEYDVPDLPVIDSRLIPSMKHNKYCFVTSVDIRLRDKTMYNFDAIMPIDKTRSIESLTTAEVYLMFHEYWANVISSDILNNDLKAEDYISVGVLELGKYPRIAFLRLDVDLLLRYIVDSLFIQTLKISLSVDKDFEESVSISNYLSKCRRKVKGSAIENFIGVAILFSWPIKLWEISNICPEAVPRCASPSVEECCVGAKNLILSYFEDFEVFSSEYPKYVNDQIPGDIENSMIIRLLKRSGLMDNDACYFCRVALLKEVIEKDGLLKLDDKLICELGHYCYNKEILFKNYKLCSFPEDILSKGSVSLTKDVVSNIRREKTSDEITDRLNDLISFMKSEEFNRKSNYIFESDSCVMSDTLQDISDIHMTESENPTRKIRVSKLYNLATNDMSSCYRTLEWILMSNIKLPRVSAKGILVLGDGLGNSSYILNKFMNRRVRGDTINDCTKAFPQTYKESKPPTYYLSETPNLLNYNESKIYICDIFDDSYVSSLYDVIDDYDMLFSEIEPEHDNKGTYYDVVSRILRIRSTKVVIKIRTTSVLELQSILTISTSNYQTVNMLVTPFCNNEKGEFYLECYDIRDTPTFITITAKFLHILVRKFTAYLEGKAWKNYTSKYFDMLNDLFITKKIHTLFLSNFKMWCINKSIDFRLGAAVFSKLLVSIMSTRNPKIIKDHLANKTKYEYQNKVQDVLLIMLLVGLSEIESDTSLLYNLNELHQFSLYRPVEKGWASTQSSINPYKMSYIIIKDDVIESIISKNPNLDFRLLGAEQLKSEDNIWRFLPLIRYHRRLNVLRPMLNIRAIQVIKFGYTKTSQRRYSDECILQLNISKTMERTISHITL
ncbi:polymerase [Yerba mate virus A]|uniref:RNA-directed RNA polymerase L n=1 Tax=Yerba mate virus A TaxID=2713499 RepID=A0A6G6CIE6_9RHAB|nr:polymerase [Yerba mate virus A]QID92311.1 polymerase [Yerba mate virus A]